MRRATILIVAVLASLSLGGATGNASGRTTDSTVTVKLGEFFFKPRVVKIHVGQSVRFVNVGKIDHTVADTDSRWNVRSRVIKPRDLPHGASQTVRFRRVGTVFYLCTFHPTLMRGKIVVVP